MFEESGRLADDDGAVFVTAVPEAPLQVSGRLGRDGLWYVGSILVAPLHEAADGTRAVIETMPGVLVLSREPVAEAMIRYCVGKMLNGARFGGGAAPQALDVLLARLALPSSARFRCGC